MQNAHECVANHVTDQLMGHTMYVRPPTQRGNDERIMEMIKINVKLFHSSHPAFTIINEFSKFAKMYVEGLINTVARQNPNI